jgi:hypothetical protein
MTRIHLRRACGRRHAVLRPYQRFKMGRTDGVSLDPFSKAAKALNVRVLARVNLRTRYIFGYTLDPIDISFVNEGVNFQIFVFEYDKCSPFITRFCTDLVMRSILEVYHPTPHESDHHKPGLAVKTRKGESDTFITASRAGSRNRRSPPPA